MVWSQHRSSYTSFSTEAKNSGEDILQARSISYMMQGVFECSASELRGLESALRAVSKSEGYIY
jgi:hypothetical protein